MSKKDDELYLNSFATEEFIRQIVVFIFDDYDD
jgi:hypothetical protein